ncbi:MAG: indolepyruvate ferredoxin oxidoreductase subunit alpha, partial [Thermoplasmata archaeon]
ATGKKVISFIGDSTFFHAGLPALINALHHNHNFTIAILDNSTTAMTGHQPHPGSNVDGMGNEATPIDIASLVKGMGVKHVEVVNPYNLKATKEAFKRALEYDGLSVVVLWQKLHAFSLI